LYAGLTSQKKKREPTIKLTRKNTHENEREKTIAKHKNANAKNKKKEGGVFDGAAQLFASYNTGTSSITSRKNIFQ